MLQHLRKIDDLERQSIMLLLDLQSFVQQIERLKPSEISVVAELLIRYKGIVDPIEDKIRDLLDIRISLYLPLLISYEQQTIFLLRT